ncbi:MAG: preprotein translocase subunit SecE [Zoogloeaceae bacterium]|jgi:preprotein translocase subunit SecE|nr:preprotein translocase subunit SecE [Zoogloeaceae bacterium]
MSKKTKSAPKPQPQVPQQPQPQEKEEVRSSLPEKFARIARNVCAGSFILMVILRFFERGERSLFGIQTETVWDAWLVTTVVWVFAASLVVLVVSHLARLRDAEVRALELASIKAAARILAPLALVAAGVAGYYLLAGQLMVLRMLAVLAGVLAGAGVFLTTARGREFLAFLRESRIELGKVVWPTRKETQQMTGVVFVFVVVMALFLFVSDKTLEWIMYDLILGWNS